MSKQLIEGSRREGCERRYAWRGTPFGEFDVLIAAHAVSLRCVLVSNDVRHFSRVPGLVVENWT